MSRQDKLNLQELTELQPESSVDDGLLPLDVRLNLDAVAAVEEERLRSCPRRPPTRGQLARLAYHLYKSRRDRSQVFDRDLFGEPAWDMLLALYCLPRQGEVLTVTSLSNAAGVPETTGLRWQATLIDEGLIERCPHVLDRRTSIIGLTHQGRLMMDQYLAKLFNCRGGIPDLD